MWDDTNLLEFQPCQKARRAQEEILRRHMAYAFARSPFYRAKLAPFAGRIPSVTLDSLQDFPLTSKSEFAEQNESFLATPMREVGDIVFSSGTTGVPTPVMYSHNDVRRLAFNERISLRACGVTPDDIALMTCTLDRCFVAGFAYYLGLTSIGAAGIRNGINTVQSHAAVMARLHPTVLVGVPGFLLKLGRYLQENGLAERMKPVRILVCVGESIRNRDMAFFPAITALESLWDAKAYSSYASSEIITTFCECTAQHGGHLHPELAVVEILDDKGNRLPAGEVGEVVLTPMQVESMPFVRFRTGDMSFLMDEPCPCGRTSARLGPIVGRRSQMMKVRGTTLYPAAFFNTLDAMKDVGSSYLTVRRGPDSGDAVAVTVSVKDTALTAEEISARLFATLRMHPHVEIDDEEKVNAKVFDVASHKPRRFFDERGQTAHSGKSGG